MSEKDKLTTDNLPPELSKKLRYWVYRRLAGTPTPIYDEKGKFSHVEYLLEGEKPSWKKRNES